MIEIVYKENKEQANGNEGYFHLPKNIRQVGDTNGRERIYLEDYVGTFLKKYFSAPEGRAAMLFGEFKWADGISYFFIRSAAAIHTMEPAPDLSSLPPSLQQHVLNIANGLQSSDPRNGLYIMLQPFGIDRNAVNVQISREQINLGSIDRALPAVPPRQ